MYVQGVPKLTAPSIACNSKSNESDWSMVYVFINSPRSFTQALVRSSIPHIELSSVFAEKAASGRPNIFDERDFDIAEFILSTL